MFLACCFNSPSRSLTHSPPSHSFFPSIPLFSPTLIYVPSTIPSSRLLLEFVGCVRFAKKKRKSFSVCARGLLGIAYFAHRNGPLRVLFPNYHDPPPNICCGAIRSFRSLKGINLVTFSNGNQTSSGALGSCWRSQRRDICYFSRNQKCRSVSKSFPRILTVSSLDPVTRLLGLIRSSQLIKRPLILRLAKRRFENTASVLDVCILTCIRIRISRRWRLVPGL